MEEKVSSTLTGLEGELKGAFYPLTGMSKDVQQKLIDDHFLFKEGDRFLQVGLKYNDISRDWDKMGNINFKITTVPHGNVFITWFVPDESLVVRICSIMIMF